MEREYHLTQGTHYIKIHNREPGTGVARVLLTTGSETPAHPVSVDTDCPPVAKSMADPETAFAPLAIRLGGPALAVYPNPVQDWLTIGLESPYTGDGRIRILDAYGRPVRELPIRKEKSVFQQDIGVADLVPGVYHLQFWEGDRQSTRSFVKH